MHPCLLPMRLWDCRHYYRDHIEGRKVGRAILSNCGKRDGRLKLFWAAVDVARASGFASKPRVWEVDGIVPEVPLQPFTRTARLEGDISLALSMIGVMDWLIVWVSARSRRSGTVGLWIVGQQNSGPARYKTITRGHLVKLVRM